MGSCTATVHKGIVIKYLWNSFMFYQLSPVWRAERGQNPSVASDTGKGGGVGGGVAKDKEKHQKKYWRDNLEMRRWGRFSRGGKGVMEAK